jgi:putative flippase GtrA
MPRADRASPRAVANARRGRAVSRQFLCYLSCAGCAALVNFVAGSVLVDNFGLASGRLFPLAVAIAYGLGMAVNLLLNRRFTFASDRTRFEQARTFIVVALSGLVLTTAIAALTRAALVWAIGAGSLAAPLGRLAAPETLSRALAIAAVSVYSFAAHKYFTFHRGIRSPLLRLVHALRFGGPVGYD